MRQALLYARSAARVFRAASEARRAAWVWRAYVTAARSVHDERVVDVRYEELRDAAPLLARELRLDEARLASSLTRSQLAEVEAGELLAELGY